MYREITASHPVYSQLPSRRLALECQVLTATMHRGSRSVIHETREDDFQKTGGDPTRPGDVKIEFYGHDAFKITSPAGLTVLTDPWRNGSTGLYPTWFLNDFPAIRVDDIVLSTHSHFDHDAVERPKALMVLERLVGQFKLGDIEITGLVDKHKCEAAPPDQPGSASAQLQVESCPPTT